MVKPAAFVYVRLSSYMGSDSRNCKVVVPCQGNSQAVVRVDFIEVMICTFCVPCQLIVFLMEHMSDIYDQLYRVLALRSANAIITCICNIRTMPCLLLYAMTFSDLK